MAQNQRSNQPSGRREPVNSSARKPAPKRKRKKMSKNGRRVLIILLVILIIVSLVFIVMVGKTLIESMTGNGTSKADSINPYSYDTTPQSLQSKVSYYVVGLLGEEATDETQLVSVVCVNKVDHTLSMLQIPQDTYLGKSDEWKVKKVSEVWANPQDLNWCEVCRKQVFAPEISDGRHNVKGCGAKVTKKKGSSSENLLQVFNDQYSLPTDDFFMLPPQALVKLVDLVDGIDVDLETTLKVDDVTYGKGVQTLSGKAALAYLDEERNTVSADVSRMVKSRKVVSALLFRLCAYSDADLEKNIIYPLQVGSTPIRTNSNTSKIVSTLKQVRDISFKNMNAFILPGQETRLSSTTFYSVHKKDVLSLLDSSFSVQGMKFSEADMRISELSNSKASNIQQQSFADIMSAQSGKEPASK